MALETRGRLFGAFLGRGWGLSWPEARPRLSVDSERGGRSPYELGGFLGRGHACVQAGEMAPSFCTGVIIRTSRMP